MKQNLQPENLQPEDSIKMPEPEMPETKKSKAPLIGMISLGALAVAGVTFGIISLINANSKSAEIEELNAKVNLLQQETGTQIIEKDEDGTAITVVAPAANQSGVFGEKDLETRTILAELKATLDAIAGSSAEYVDFEAVSKDERESKCTYESHTTFDSLKTATLLDKSYSIRYDSNSVDEPLLVEDKVAEKLTSLGFTEIKPTAWIWSNSIYINPDSNIICSVNYFGTSCGYYKWVYDETITLVNQLAEAYKNKEGEYPGVVELCEYSTIKNSKVPPYQTIDVSFHGGGGSFYRVSPSAEWQFFGGGQTAFSCDEYNTQDLKNVYAGEVCYDEVSGTNLTVQP